MRFVPHCRSTQSSSGDAMRSRPAAGLWQETLTACRSARRRFWTSWSSIRSGRSAPRRRRGESRVACATKNYGTGGDCSLGSVEIAPDGRIAIHCDGVEIGTGIGTAAANRVAAHLGAVADEIALARVDAFGPLGLVASGNPYTMDQQAQDAAARNPRWVPAISSGTGASTSAHVGTRPAGEAARVIFRFGLWPAALELWGIAPNDPRANQWEKARWNDGQLILPGLAPLPLPAIAAKAH